MVGIYKITSPSNRVYIGQSWDVERRIRTYKEHCVDSHKGQRKLYFSFLKYGASEHKFEVILELSQDTTQEILDNIEVSFIKQCKESGARLLNLQEGGRGGKHSEESRLKMSISHTGKKLSEEHVQKIVNGNTGKKRTEEYKQLMSELNTGKTHSEETRQKISQAKKEFFKTNEVHNKGKVLDKEGRKILSDASTCKRVVLQYTKTGDLVREWDSIVEAAKTLDIFPAHITRVCKGGRPSAKNFIWKYKQ